MMPEGNPSLEGGSGYIWEKQADASVPCSLKTALEAAPAFYRTEDTGGQNSPYLSLHQGSIRTDSSGASSFCVRI